MAAFWSTATYGDMPSIKRTWAPLSYVTKLTNFEKGKNTLLTHRFEITVEVSRESVLPEIDLIGELCFGHLESLRSDVHVLKAKLVRKMDEGQRNVISIETLGRKRVSKMRNQRRLSRGSHHRNRG